MRDEPEFWIWLHLPAVASLEDLMAFDRQACAAGYKRFARRCDAHDLPADMASDAYHTVLVEEVMPGVRLRRFLEGRGDATAQKDSGPPGAGAAELAAKGEVPYGKRRGQQPDRA